MNPRTTSAESVRLFDADDPLVTESGSSLLEVTVAFEQFGEMNKDGTNVIVICHALTANAHAGGTDEGPGWWEGVVGPGKAFDTRTYAVICSNILGSCYGTTGPRSLDPRTGKEYRMEFPLISVRDMVRVQKKLLDLLGVKSLVTVCGSSLGGMQVLEWGVMYPDFCRSIVPISTAARQTAWCIALNGVARRAITADPLWKCGGYDAQPAEGLSLARMVGMISYRSWEEFEQRFGRTRMGQNGRERESMFAVESYLQHQGKKLVDRFDACTYVLLSRAMDLHDVAEQRGTVQEVLGSIRAKTLCIGFSSDNRYPPANQKEIARYVPDASYSEISSIHGHDGFLTDQEPLNRLIHQFLNESGVA
jgi:homoserine O-acetyltransferase/O-succinyltransferase